MSINIPSHFGIEYAMKLELLLQQPGSFLRSRVETGTHQGKQASPVDQMGAVEGQVPAGRFAPIGRVDAPLARRWVFPTDTDLPQLLDKFDMLRLLNSGAYLAKYQQNAANGLGRKIDDQIIAAALGTSVTGETGAGTEAFDTTNCSVAATFGASGSVGLTVAKLIEADRIFASFDVDLSKEEKTLVISPKQHANLKNQIEYISKDYGPARIDEQGNVQSFMGYTIIISNRLAFSSGTVRADIAMLRSGMHLGLWNDIETDVDQRTDLSSKPWQVYSRMTVGATRLEQGRVVRILSDEA